MTLSRACRHVIGAYATSPTALASAWPPPRAPFSMCLISAWSRSDMAPNWDSQNERRVWVGALRAVGRHACGGKGGGGKSHSPTLNLRADEAEQRRGHAT